MRRAACLGVVFFLFSASNAAAPDAAWSAPKKSARRRHRSHRWRDADIERRRRLREEAKKEKKNKKRQRLLLGRWRPEIADALEKVLHEYGKGTADYRPEDPPVAVFSWDDVAISHHVGDAVFARLVAEAEFKFNDDFWQRIPVHYGRVRIRAAYNEFHKLSRASWKRNAYYQIYRKQFFKCYRSYCREYGEKKCALWRVQLMAGFSEGELRLYVRRVIDDELKRTVGWEKIGDTLEDPDPVKARAGLRWIPEMKDLFAKLKEKGFDVWVLSSSNQWAVEEMAKEYGVFRSRVAGIRLKTLDGVMSAEPLLPLPHGGGMAEAIVMFIGRSPVLIIGGEKDEELLKYGRGTRVRIVDSTEGLPGMTRAGGLAQPRFSPVRLPQERGAVGR